MVRQAKLGRTKRSPVVKRVMVAETNTDAADSFCAAPGGTGHRDMARSALLYNRTIGILQDGCAF